MGSAADPYQSSQTPVLPSRKNVDTRAPVTTNF